MSFAVVSSDGFSGTSADINGRTMDAAGGGSANTWSLDAIDSGGVSVGSGVCAFNGNNAQAHDSTATAAADMRVSCKLTGASAHGGVLARWNGTGDYYLGLCTMPDGKIFSRVSGSYSLLGTGGSFATNDVIGLTVVGTALSLQKNGTDVITGITDSSFATGYAGIFGYDTETADDWLYEVDAGGGGGVVGFARIFLQAVQRAAVR